MRRYRVEVRQPSHLLGAHSDEPAVFEAAWARLQMKDSQWRNHLILERDDLFMKGFRASMWVHPQHWRRRYHIRNEFRSLVQLTQLGLEVPMPVAWGCEFVAGIPLRSFLVVEAIRDGLDFSVFTKDGSHDSEALFGCRRVDVFRAAGEAVRALHENGLVHGDLACRNILLRRGPPFRAIIVDVARMRPGAGTGGRAWRIRKDLYRLMKTTEKCGATPEELAAMLEAAAGEHADNIIQSTHRIRRFKVRWIRKCRSYFWRLTGR